MRYWSAFGTDAKTRSAIKICKCLALFAIPLLLALQPMAAYSEGVTPLEPQPPNDQQSTQEPSVPPEARLTADTAFGLQIESISINNPRGRTRQSYVRTKLGITEGDSFSSEALSYGLQALSNTRIFKNVHAEVFQGKAPGSAHIDLHLEEKWTTLPDLRFGGGGGTAFYRLGVYDINWLGLGIEGLFSYENRNGTHNGDAWLRWPHAWETQNMFGFGIRRQTDILLDYSSDQTVLGGEAMTKTTLLLDFERPLTNLVTFGYRMEPEWVAFPASMVPDKAKQGNEALGRLTSEQTRRILHRTQLRIGRINHYGAHARGLELQTQWLPAFAGFGSDRDLLLTSHQLRFFWLMPFDAHVAARAVYETSSSGRSEDLNRFGGLGEVRGYRDLEFSGRHIAFANLEYRQTVFRAWSLIWQPAVFFDTAWAADTVWGLTTARARDATGFGLRIIPEFVHLIAVRLDYALAVSDPRNGGGLSFGMLQLF
jgi:outer membrane protein assembly factor BamA